jgi:Uma2 family endonuclease
MQPAPAPAFTAEQYLAWEQQQASKHEYLRGEVYAMAGASDAHVTIAGNLFAALRAHLRGGPCRTYIADMKVEVDAVNAYFYPDVFVSCDAADAQLPDRKRAPKLVAEVLSPSTAAFDRGAKFAWYRQLQSLHEYVLIDTERVAVDLFRRDATGHWVLYPYAEGETVELQSVGLLLPVAEIYADVRLEAAGVAPASSG